MKRGAIELSLGTIVIVILAVLFLIMGIVLVRQLMCSAIGGIKIFDDAVKESMRNLYVTEDKNVVIKEKYNDIPRASGYRVGILIKNEDKANTKFSYDIVASDLGSCGITKQEAESYIDIGKTGRDMDISIGNDIGIEVIFKIPKDAPLCTIRYTVNAQNGNDPYDSNNFDITIKKASAFNSVMC
jgi:hypothetical protein